MCHEYNVATLVFAEILDVPFSFLPQGFSTFRTVDHPDPLNVKFADAIKGIVSKLEICYKLVHKTKESNKKPMKACLSILNLFWRANL